MFVTKVQSYTNIKITGGEKDSADDHVGLMGFACSVNTNMSLTDFALALKNVVIHVYLSAKTP